MLSRQQSFASLCACAVMTAQSGCSRTLRTEPEALSVSVDALKVVPADRAASSVSASSRGGVAVVELFTSEGCSSCPPADRELARVASRAVAESHAVYTLSFHVDYWNYLGWRDRFSSADYSERQRGYASLGENAGTYTPQAVVNGAAECVGSNAPALDQLIQAALQREPRTQIELQAERTDGGIRVSYRVTGDTQGKVLNLALLDPHAESVVKSGENAGEHLTHVNVVRAFASRSLAEGSTGSWSAKPSTDFDARHVSLVAFTEGSEQRDISGAAALELR